MKQRRTQQELLKASHSPLVNHYHTQQDVIERHKKGPEDNVTHTLNHFLFSLYNKFVVFPFHYLKSRFGKHYRAQPYPIEGDDGLYRFSSKGVARIALTSDWATDTAEAGEVMYQMKNQHPHFTIHLGDIYYVGTPEEVTENFNPVSGFWQHGKYGSLCIPGNHEMYSNGKGYFDTLLSYMHLQQEGQTVRQKSSYWCLENDWWRIIALDTGHHSLSIPGWEYLHQPQTFIDHQAIKWLSETVKINEPGDHRGLIILTHHQYFSQGKNIFQKPAEQLKDLLPANREVIWFWGHEHVLCGFEKYQSETGVAAWGRCIGHGGMPIVLPKDITPIKKPYPVFTDRRVYKTIGTDKLGYNGFALLEFTDQHLHVDYIDMEGTTIASERFHTNFTNGAISHQLLP